MRAIVVRHYKTASNETDHIIGWGDSPPAETWLEDLQHVDKVLLKAKLTIDHIYTSSLNRAKNTGRFYADSMGIKNVIDTPALNEVNYGKLYNKSKKWVEKHVHGHKKDPDLVYTDGESFNQMKKRCIAFITSIDVTHPEATILVVVHAGVIRALVSHYLGLDYANNLTRKIGHRYIGDFTIENGVCIRYDELGKPSGFIRDGKVKTPLYRTNPANNSFLKQ